jgi:alkanesulfonate monooxygenase SsuD/methylene tetrahydromethanopterin reductase-like flavin-dependent oxidoreductase (luciferase family)
MFGWDLLDIPQRMARFEEGIQIVKTLFENDEPSTFEGEYYQIREAVVLPRPARAGGPPLLVGGNGEKVTMPIAAKYASEWNGIYLQPDEFAKKCSHMDELLKAEGREPNSMKRSMMGGLEFGRDEAEVNDLVEKRTQGKLDKARLRGRSVLVGTTAEIVDHLGELEQAGCQRIMLQWLALDDLDRLEAFGSSVLPQLN